VAQFLLSKTQNSSYMKKLGYFTALVFMSLVSVAFFTTVTAVTLASYAKGEKHSTTLTKSSDSESETVKR
jgi:hypothetical protein